MMTTIPAPSPNRVSRLMVIDLGGMVDNNITEIVDFAAGPQPGYPRSSSFVPLTQNVCRAANGLLQAIAVLVESFTLPISLTMPIRTASGTVYEFST
jgi:hypothetical protein